jgi:hypothetical protein
MEKDDIVIPLYIELHEINIYKIKVKSPMLNYSTPTLSPRQVTPAENPISTQIGERLGERTERLFCLC